MSPGKHVGRRGEDIVRGTTLFEPGRVLRPQDLGVLSSVGQPEARVVRRPRVRLAVTGNELLSAGSHPHGFHIADANGPMLAALIERDGGVVDFPGLVRDDPGWEVCAPRHFSVVCFRREGSDEENEKIVERVNRSGEIFLSHTRLDGRYVLRLAVGNERTTEADIHRAWRAVAA